jgi:hypothetical protein
MVKMSEDIHNIRNITEALLMASKDINVVDVNAEKKEGPKYWSLVTRMRENITVAK